MAGLDQLTTNPTSSVMDDANPLSGLTVLAEQSDPAQLQGAIANTRANAYAANPQDPFNSFVTMMTPDITAILRQREASQQAQQAQQAEQQAYLQSLAATFGPEQSSRLGWDAVGKMAQGWSTGDWGAGLRNIIGATSENQAMIQKARDDYAAAKLGVANQGEATAARELKDLRTDFKDKATVLGSLLREQMIENRMLAVNENTQSTRRELASEATANKKAETEAKLAEQREKRYQTAVDAKLKYMDLTGLTAAQVAQLRDVEINKLRTGDLARLGKLTPENLGVETSTGEPVAMAMDYSDPTLPLQLAKMKASPEYKAGEPGIVAAVAEIESNLAAPEVKMQPPKLSAMQQTPDPEYVAARVKSIVENNTGLPSAWELRTPQGQAIMKGVLALKPDYNSADYQMILKSVKDFGTGKQGDQVRSFNTAVNHLQTLEDLAKALQNGDTQLFNKIGNAWARQTGKSAPTNLNSAVQIVGGEITKAIIPGGGGATERIESREVFGDPQSPEQLLGAINTTRDLMRGQLSTMKGQYEYTTKRNNFAQLLTPEARRVAGMEWADINAEENSKLTPALPVTPPKSTNTKGWGLHFSPSTNSYWYVGPKGEKEKAQ